MSELIFLDTETTGLEVGTHQIWEVAWARGLDEEVNVFQVTHNLVRADLQALKINGYMDRVDPLYYSPWHVHEGDISLFEQENGERELYNALYGNHLVASNPDFDSRMLAHRWGERPWNHRMIDIAPMAMPYFAWDRPKGLKDIANALRAEGYTIPEPDHTAKRDVETLRACYIALTTGL